MNSSHRQIIEWVKNSIYGACLYLDDEQWPDWLALCAEDFNYKITAYSPEIRKDMIYFAHSFNELKSMTEMLPKHNTDHSPLKRHATVYSTEVAKDLETVEAVTSVVIYQNMLDGVNSHIDSGETRLFCVGRYIDKLVITNNQAKFVDREVRLENRRLDKGSHWPL